MNTILGASGVLERHRGFIVKSLKVAALAAPVLLSAAPSHAGTVSKTFGFEGAFDPLNWTRTTNTTATFNDPATTLTLTRAASVGTTSASWTLDQDKLDELIDDRPTNAKPVFLGGEFKYDWSWTPSGNLSADTATTATKNAFKFNMFNLGEVTQVMVISGARTGGTAVTGSSSNPAGLITGLGDSFAFNLIRETKALASTTVTSTGTITNFQFTAFYEEVPGPLPLAGAAAAFAWSRRLRRRLSVAQPQA